MRILIQRVKNCSVTIDEEVRSSIGAGMLILVGIEDSDSLEDVEWLAGKAAKMRIFNDEAGVMNKSVTEVDGEVMIVSQFTLHATVKKGNRPSYIRAAKPEISVPLYEEFIKAVERETGKKAGTGLFVADMKVALFNDGPVTIWIDSKNRE